MFKLFFSPLVALCLTGFGVFLIYAGHKNANEFGSLLDHGEIAEAEITKLEWQEKKSNHIDSRYTAYIRFATADGREVRDEMHIPTELGRSLRNQESPSAITIRYLPESPTTFREASATDPSDAQSAVGGYMLLAGIAILILRVLFNRK